MKEWIIIAILFVGAVLAVEYLPHPTRSPETIYVYEGGGRMGTIHQSCETRYIATMQDGSELWVTTCGGGGGGK